MVILKLKLKKQFDRLNEISKVGGEKKRKV